MSLEQIITLITNSDKDLDLSQAKLADNIHNPDELERVCKALLEKKDQLQTIDLSNNNLNRLVFFYSKPDERQNAKLQLFNTLGQLKLTSLNLARNQLFSRGSAVNYTPDVFRFCTELFAPLGQLNELENLDLSYNDLQDAYPEDMLINNSIDNNQKESYIEKVTTKHFIRQLFSLKNLRSLNISGNVDSLSSHSFAKNKLLWPILIEFLENLPRLAHITMRDMVLFDLREPYSSAFFLVLNKLPLIEIDFANLTIKRSGSGNLGNSEETMIIYWNRILALTELNTINKLGIVNNGAAIISEYSDCDGYAIVQMALQFKLNQFPVVLDKSECDRVALLLFHAEAIVKNCILFVIERPVEERNLLISHNRLLTYSVTGKKVLPDILPAFDGNTSGPENFRILIEVGFDYFTNILLFKLLYGNESDELAKSLESWYQIINKFVCQSKVYPNINNALINLMRYAKERQWLFDLTLRFIITAPTDDVNLRFEFVEKTVMERKLGQTIQAILLPMLPIFFNSEGHAIDFTKLSNDKLLVLDAILLDASNTDTMKLTSRAVLPGGERVRRLIALRNLQTSPNIPNTTTSADQQPGETKSKPLAGLNC